METRVRRMTRKGPGIASGSLQSLGGKKGAPEAQPEPQSQACSPIIIYPH